MIQKSFALLGFLVAFAIGTPVFAQTSSDAIIGEWLNEEGDAKVTIYQDGKKFYGKISWLQDALDDNGRPRVDENNPKEGLQSRKLDGLVILKDFTFDGKEWRGGKIYDPKSGKTYNCYMELLEPGKLKIRGYIGQAWMGLGRTTFWTR